MHDSLVMADSDSDWENGVGTAEGNLDDGMDGDELSQSEDGSNPYPKSSGETKLKTRPLKHKTSAAALTNPSNFLKRSHQVLILDDNGDRKEAQDEETAKRRKKLRRVNFETEEDDGLDYLPSFERVTNRGGYAHTKNSRMKISEANKGKMPWNKGKSRSEEAKSKISAGVRARNHVILLEKLKKLGISEEEWFEKKVKIKHLRERVRKARLAVKQHEQDMEITRKKQEEDNFEQALIHAMQREESEDRKHSEEQLSYDSKNLDESPMHRKGKLKLEEVPPEDSCVGAETGVYSIDKAINDTTLSTENPPSQESIHMTAEGELKANETAASEKSASSEVIKVGRFRDIARAQTNTFEFPDSLPSPPTAILLGPEPVSVMVGEARKTNHTPNIFFDDEKPEAPKYRAFSLSTHEVSWKPHDLAGVSYSDNRCPVGGPGGLICCTTCTSRYSQFLSTTFNDLERHQIVNLGEEVDEILEYSRETTNRLAESSKAAKQKVSASDPIMFS